MSSARSTITEGAAAPLSPPGMGDAARAVYPPPPAAPDPGTVPAPRRPAAPPAELLDELVASGRLTEAQMLDLAAHHLRCGRVSLALAPPDPSLDDLLPPATALRHATLPWRRDGGWLVLATARPEIAADPERLLPPGLGPAEAVLAPRAEIQAALAARHRAALTRKMAARPAPRDSFRTYTPSRQRAFAVLCATLVVLTAMALAPAAVFLVLLAVAIVTLCLALLLKSAAALARLRPAPRRPQPPPNLIDLPSISILVPLFRERDIAGRLVRRLRALEYPRGRLEVLLVLEENDHLTAEALAETELPPWMRVVVVPDGRPRTKPRAMNYALDFCRGEIIGIYDAEDAPAPDQLMTVAARFAAAPPEVACLQGALDFYNPRDSWISRCFALEYNAWFRLYLPGMARLGLAVPLGGTTLFVRRDALEQVGAWDAHNVTEDADLGFRLARYGWRTEVIDTTTWEEATARPLPWIRQRSRWLKGYMVTYIVHMRRPRALWRELGPRRFAGFQVHFVAALAQFLLGPLLWAFGLIALGAGHPILTGVPEGLRTAVPVLFLLAALVDGAFAMLATHRPTHRHLWVWVPALLVYYTMGWVAAYKALFELLVMPFYWDKTAHGRTSAAPGA